MIFTDNIAFIERYIGRTDNSTENELISNSNVIIDLFQNPDNIISFEYAFENSIFNDSYFIEYAEQSQYDVLIKLAQISKISNNLICIAGSGKKFHGFRNRHWESLQGNIHLSAYFKPNTMIKNYGIGFLILSAVSVVMALDDLPGLKNRAKIKWVNDILIEKAKVCGVLAHTFAQGEIVTDAILGIGLNVEQTPKIEPNLFVPRSACLNDFLSGSEKTNELAVFRNLLKYLTINYNILVSGGYDYLLKNYIEKSAIINKKVSIWSDARDGKIELLRQGTVLKIGENLELYLDDSNVPVYDGRLAMEE